MTDTGVYRKGGLAVATAEQRAGRNDHRGGCAENDGCVRDGTGFAINPLHSRCTGADGYRTLGTCNPNRRAYGNSHESLPHHSSGTHGRLWGLGVQ